MTEELIKAVDTLGKGGVLLHPTSTVYGLACLPESEDSCNRVRSIKGNPPNKALLLITDNFERVDSWFIVRSEIERSLMQIESPDLQMTILLKASPQCPTGPRADSEFIGIRKTGHRLSLDIIGQANSALVSTSANYQGEAPTSSFRDLPSSLIEICDFHINDDSASNGEPSCIVKVEDNKINILRTSPDSVKLLSELVGTENIIILSR